MHKTILSVLLMPLSIIAHNQFFSVNPFSEIAEEPPAIFFSGEQGPFARMFDQEGQSNRISTINPFFYAQEEQFVFMPCTVFLFAKEGNPFAENSNPIFKGSVFFPNEKVEKFSDYMPKSYALIMYLIALIEEIKFIENELKMPGCYEEKSILREKIKKVMLNLFRNIIDPAVVIYFCKLDNQNNPVFEKFTLLSFCKNHDIRLFLEEQGAIANYAFLDDSYLLEHSKELFEVDLKG